ncbi:hypothetical protein SDC9_105311 [bioreactor metagenome]|uniref:Flavodoxin-like domain-containing protein n=1 Tax=bioreactor metagenome TaxID=1076179 RepID=A0A645AZ68_9ZZZZ
MKNLIVYYSMTGNTRVLAREIHRIAGGDLIEIEEIKKRSPNKMMGPAFEALIGKKSAIKPMDSIEKYDTILIGTPVWASRSTPAVNSFLSKAKLNGKKIYLFFTLADDKKPQSLIDSMTKRIEKHGARVEDSFFIQTSMKKLISPEELEKPLFEWLKNNLHI